MEVRIGNALRWRRRRGDGEGMSVVGFFGWGNAAIESVAGIEEYESSARRLRYT